MKKEFTVEEAKEFTELYNVLRGLVKRVEALEKLTGIAKPMEGPCLYCNVIGNHQKWCQRDANRTSGT